MSARALGGGALQGERLVRFVYLDESGIGKIEHDPFVVTAGVIVHADKQWKALEQSLHDLADRMIRPEDRQGFYFHATDLFHGTKKTSREHYSKETRWGVLREICSLVQKFNLPVVAGHVDRQALYLPGEDLKAKTWAAQAITAMRCAIATECYMREKADVGEVATMVYENNDRSKGNIKHLHRLLQDSTLAKRLAAVRLCQERAITTYLPLERIVDTAHFASKQDTSILQIADACAFVIKRHLMGAPDAEYFFEPIRKQQVELPQLF